MKNLLCITIILSISLSAIGQKKRRNCDSCGSLKGFIYRSDSLPPENANIYLVQGEQIKDSTLTDCAGFFSIPEIYVGRYDVIVQASNHEKHVITGTIVSPEKTTLLYFNMTPDTGSRGFYVEAYRVPLIDKLAPRSRITINICDEGTPQRLHQGTPASKSGSID